MTNWPHGPAHLLDWAGTYMVTAATYKKLPLFASAKRLAQLCDHLRELAPLHGWQLHTWAVFPNHYHFVGSTHRKADSLRRFISHLHSATAKEVNAQDDVPGRRVWFQYWDSHLTFQRSYLVRLNYVHTNAVKHGVVRQPSQYAWCSAGWFELEARQSFYQTVMRLRSDLVQVMDDFTVDLADIG